MVMKTVLNVKVDPKVKKSAQKLAKTIGLPLSVIVNNSLKNFVHDRQITFVALTPNKILSARLEKIRQDTQKGRNISPVFSSMNKAITYLHEQSR